MASPALAGCVTSGSVGGPVGVHLAFEPPPGLLGISIRELRIHEQAGHVADIVQVGGWSGAAHPECGDGGTTMYADVGWLTTASHNGEYLITATVDYSYTTGDPMQPFASGSASAQMTVTVGNLIITSTTPQNPAPVLWDPETMQAVSLAAAYSCAYRASGTAQVAIYTCEGQLVRTLSQPFVTSGSNVVFAWDGLADGALTGDPPQPAGVYLFRFNLGVQSHGPYYEDSDKSALLGVVAVEVELFDHDDYTSSTAFDVRYSLSDAGNPTQAASEAEVSAFQDAPPTLLNSVPGGTLTAPPPDGALNSVSMPVSFDANGDLIFLATAQDNHAVRDKGHRQRWAMQKGLPLRLPIADNYNLIATSPGVDTSARHWQRKLWDAALGYKSLYNARANGAKPASVIYARLPKDSLMHFNGHGGQGGGSVATSDHLLVAVRTTENYVPSRFYLSELAANALSKTLLVVWQACQSGRPSLSDGSLLTVVIDKGASTALGFDDDLHFEDIPGNPSDYSRDWANAFWQALCQGADATGGPNGQPRTVLSAARYARDQVRFLNGDRPHGYESFRIEGDPHLKVVPAR